MQDIQPHWVAEGGKAGGMEADEGGEGRAKVEVGGGSVEGIGGVRMRRRGSKPQSSGQRQVCCSHNRLAGRA